MRIRVLTGCCLGLLLIACGDDDGSTPSAADAGAAIPASEQCPKDTEEFRYGPNGLMRKDEKNNIAVRIDDAEYAPPAKDFNDWTIAITDASGGPLPKAQITWVCAWMPVHGHGSNPKRLNKLDGGRFELKQQNLSMYGGWQIKLWIDPDGGSMEYQPQGGSGVLGGDVCIPVGDATALPNIQFDVCVPRARGS